MPPNAGELARPQSPLRGIMPQSPLRIKQDGKFYERLLTKESSGANPSFRYYWAEPGSVPFVWESQPGTPRDASRTAGGALPAITPPPSYLLRHAGGKAQATASSRHPKSRAKGKNWYRLKRFKVGFISSIFRRLALGKLAWCRRWAPSSAQVSSSSSRWLFSSVATEKGEQQRRPHHHQYGRDPAAQKSAVLCSGARPSPWMLRFRGLGNRNRHDGWA